MRLDWGGRGAFHERSRAYYGGGIDGDGPHEKDPVVRCGGGIIKCVVNETPGVIEALVMRDIYCKGSDRIAPRALNSGGSSSICAALGHARSTNARMIMKRFI